MRFFPSLFIFAVVAPEIASGDVVLATRTLRSHTILTKNDVVLKTSENEGAISTLSEVIGKEARVVLYQGRPITLSDIGPPAIIERNQIVTIIYSSGLLSISSDGRSLSRAGVGDIAKAMNLSSRKTISGRVNASGEIVVGNSIPSLHN